MAYKKFIRKNGKLFGPYYYESYRDADGKVRKRYVGTKNPDKFIRKTKKRIKKSKKIIKTHKRLFLIIGVILGVFLLLIIGNLGYYQRTTGRAIQGAEASPSEVEIAR